MVGLLVLLVVALPAGWAAILAVASFSGCFIECTRPEPLVGSLLSGVAVFLLALPIVTGMLVARVPLARGWPWFIGVTALLLVGVIYGQRVA